MAKQILGKVVPIPRGEYNSSTQYEMLDIVTYNGSSYIAKTSVRGQVPTNTTYWQLLAKQGDKPVYKVDYLTPTEMQSIVNEIIEDSANAFNQDVAAKTNEFDGNASSKTTAFNNNAAQKTTDFNNNASAKSNAFNQNAIDKSNAFNTNAQSKQDDFNTNATAATSDYNSNALAKTNAFNDNATAKQGAYDSNHTTKLGAYNDNAVSKTTAFDNNASDKTTAFNKNVEDKTEEFNEYAGSFDRRIIDNSNRIAHIENDLFDSGNASGSNITLNDSTLAEFKEIREDGISEQVTTTGKNLLPNTIETRVLSNVTISKNSDGSLTLNGTATSANNVVIGRLDVEDGDTLTISGINGFSDTTLQMFTSSDVAFSIGNRLQCFDGPVTRTSQGNENITVKLYLYEGVTYNNVSIYPMIEKNSSGTSYEPFTGGEPSPSPSYEQPITSLTGTHHIEVCGKNLNSGLRTGYYRESDGAYISSTGDSCSINPIRVIAGNTYIYSIDGSTIRGYAYEYDINNNYIRRTAIVDNGRYIPSSNVAYFHYSFSDGTIANVPLDAKAQIELGTQATTYEPYVGTSTEITIPQGEFIGKINETYKDQIRLSYNETDGEYHAYLDKVIGKRILNGSEGFGYNSNDLWFYYHQQDKKIGNSPLLCDYGIYYSYDNFRNANKPEGVSSRVDNDLILIRNKNITNINDFNNWLSTHNAEIQYVLATPYTLDLGVIEMPLSYYPITNITTDSELQPLLNVEYYRDFKGTISSMQNTIQSLDERITALEEA